MKLYNNLWATIWVLNTIKIVIGTICGEGWIFSGASQKCFHISNERQTFMDATKACDNGSGGRLASVALMEDVEILRQHNRFQGVEFWIYLYKESHDNDITDVNDRRRQFNWGDGSPSNSWAIGFWDPWEPQQTERHGRLADNMSSFKGDPDNVLHGYICQKTIPETTTKVTSTPEARRQESTAAVSNSSPSTNGSDVDVSTETVGGDTMALMSNMDNRIYIAYGVGGGVALIVIIVIIVAVVLVKKRKSRTKNNTEPSVEYSYANEIATSDLKYDDQQYANVNMEYSTVADMQPDPGYDSARDNSNVKHVPMYPSYDEVNFTNHDPQKVAQDVGDINNHDLGDPGNAPPLYSVVDVSKKPGRGYQNVNVNSGSNVDSEAAKVAEARRISNMYSKPVKR